MKRESPVTVAVGLVMACLLSFGAMGAMITGLQLPVSHPSALCLAWAAAALAGCILSLVKRGWIPTLILSVLAVGFLWKYHDLALPIQALIARLSWLYDSAYHWGTIEFSGVDWPLVPLDLPLGIFGCLIALTAAEAMVRGRGLIAPVGLALMPLTATLVVTNTVPDPVWLYMLILAVAELVLTAAVRRQSPRQGAKLAILSTLPAALLLGLLFRAYPKDTYVNRSEEQLDAAIHWFQSLDLFSGETGGLSDRIPTGPDSSATTNLRRLGPRNIRDYPVMEVTARRGGTVYLRGQDFDIYDGTSWSAAAIRTEELKAPYGDSSAVTVKTLRPMNVLYIPYPPADGLTTEGGRIENTEDLTEYTYNVVTDPYKSISYGAFDDGTTIVLGEAVIADDLVAEDPLIDGALNFRDHYTRLPEQTRAWAEDYVAEVFRASGIDASAAAYMSTGTLVQYVADHVRACAPYDTNTPRMDPRYDDFVRWFLEESDRGYCVHFATATAVLLRAAGIPARYVTGYMVPCESQETVTVTADMAHAWVEYYDSASGVWYVLESTPADLRDPEAETETEAPTTAPPTEAPTDAEDATRPDGPGPIDKDNPKLNLKPLWTALKWLAGIAAAAAAFFGQYRLRREIFRRRFAGSRPNTRALLLWQRVERICRVTKQPFPEDLHALAEKAKFSQYSLTREEVEAFTAWLAEQREALKQAPWYLRIVYQYVLALW